MTDVELLRYCNKISYVSIQDMNRLYHHGRGANKFLQDLNRAETVACLDEQQGPDPAKLPLASETCLRERAERLLTRYDTGELPPPLWLRVLPACLRIAETYAPDKVLWIAVSLETDVEHAGSRPLRTTVNINSRENVGNVAELFAQKRIYEPVGLTDILIRGRGYSRGGGPTGYGARFRSVAHGNGETDNGTGPWIDIHATNVQPRLIPEQVVYKLGDPLELAQKDKKAAREAFERWADTDTDEGSGETKSKVLSTYCKELASFCPNSSSPWPDTGIDALLCPAPYWYWDPEESTTSATIFWGFKGYVPSVTYRSIFALSQVLLSATPVLGKLLRAEERGRERERYASSHAFPQLESLRARTQELIKELDSDDTKSENLKVHAEALRKISANLEVDSMLAEMRKTKKLPSGDNSVEAEWTDELLKQYLRTYTEDFVRNRLRRKDASTLENGFEAIIKASKVSCSNNASLSGTSHLRCLLVVLLRNAAHHATSYALSNGDNKGVSLELCVNGNELILENSGIGGASERGETFKEVELINGLTGQGWKVKMSSAANGSHFASHTNSTWKTTLKLENGTS